MRRVLPLCVVAVGFFPFAFGKTLAGEDSLDERIPRWTQDLGSAQFQAREEASRQLRSAGGSAAPALGRAAVSPDWEVRTRAMAILAELLASNDANTYRCALRTLRRLENSGNPFASRAAATVLGEWLPRKRLELYAALKEQGVSISPGLTRKTMTIQADALYFPERGAHFPSVAEMESLELFPELRRLGLTMQTSAGCSVLDRLPNLESLSLYCRTLDPTDLSHLAQLTRLTSLALWGASIGDAELRSFQPMSRLEYLSLNRTNITDAGIDNLTHFRSLKFLHISHARISDEGVGKLSPLGSVESLTLSYMDIGDRGLHHLASWRALRVLNLSGTQITDAGLQHLAALPNLVDLSVNDTAITDRGMTLLPKFPQLRHVWLAGANVSDAGLAHLADMPRLERLGVSGAKITDAGLKHLQPHRESLDHLTLQATAVTDEGLQQLRSFRNLRRLHLGDCAVTLAGVEALQKSVPLLSVTPFEKYRRPQPPDPNDPFAKKPH